MAVQILALVQVIGIAFMAQRLLRDWLVVRREIAVATAAAGPARGIAART